MGNATIRTLEVAIIVLTTGIVGTMVSKEFESITAIMLAIIALAGAIVGTIVSIETEAIIAIIALAALIVGSLLSWKIAKGGLWLTVRHFKLARTVSYMERLNHPNMARTRARVNIWLQSSTSDKKRIEEANANPYLHTQILSFVNLFIELGVAFRHGLLDRKMTFDLWSYLVPHYWEKLKFWVQKGETLSSNDSGAFENLANEMWKPSRKSGK